ncbi:hypothetical protein D8B26_001455 [Coccidioides posadasii str. Silveira]|uniref:uncharacterized protein n=1 Tax=Coccidioides posadasii (strain RMSCC 757 / Silveira) TaxID=443226 RepID=UPI001BF129E4|nr:hypothetical protein D8B26_001455 [Coccidioides posadasii str. Silveira]
MQQVENNYKEFVLENLNPPCPNHWLKSLTINVIEAFLRWYLDCHNVGSLPGFLVLVRFWRIYYCYELDMDFPYRLKRKTKEVGLQIIMLFNDLILIFLTVNLYGSQV